MHKAIYTHIWDFLDEGVACVLERIQRAGCREVIVAMAYHAGRFLLPHNPRRIIYYPEDGVIYFNADNSRGAGRRIQPLTASIICGRENLMTEIIDRAKDMGLSVTAWFVCLHNSRLGFLHSDLVARNAFGDPYYHYLCPMNPDASGYALNMLDGFTARYACKGIFLESLSYSGFPHGYHHEFYGVTINAELSALLGLCFCAACRRAAEQKGIDAEKLAEAVRQRINACLEYSGREKRPERNDDMRGAMESIAGLCGMKDFLRMRCERVEQLLAEAVRITRTRKMRMDFFGPVYAPVNAGLLEGIDPAGLSANMDRYVLPIEATDPALVEHEILYAKQFRDPGKIVLSLRLFNNATPSPQNLKAKAELAERHGLAGCNFYNYGMAPLDRLAWVKDIR